MMTRAHLALAWLGAAAAFAPAGRLLRRARPLRAAAVDTAPAVDSLFAAIERFRAAEASDGVGYVDNFGVKGGELDKDTRAPSNLMDSWSPPVRAAADEVVSCIDALAAVNPTPDATALLGTAEGARCPLDGAWANVWTTAADASFSPNSTRGDASVFNVVDAAKGRVTNVIDFVPGPNAKLSQFRVSLAATALTRARVGLRFRLVRARLAKPLLFGLIKQITIPVPGPFITRILTLLRRGPKDGPPPAYFDVLYLDANLRIHKTGQGNLFVQRRPEWTR